MVLYLWTQKCLHQTWVQHCLQPHRPMIIDETWFPIYWIWHLFLPFKKYFRRLYLAKKSNWRLLMAPRLLVRMTSTASSYFMPSSISATATKTGARPRPVTQCTPTQVSGSSLNSFLTNPSHFSTISWEGGDPSVKE